MRAEVIQAVETLRQNHPDSIERALEQLQGTVFSFSMKLCGNREDAEDTTQETLLQAVPYLQRFDRPEALTLWLYKVAKSRCLMSRRKSKFAPSVQLSLEELMQTRREPRKPAGATEDTPETLMLQREVRQRLQQAVLQLPLSHRLVIVLHDMEGLSTKETAALLGIREGTMRVRLHRARLFVQSELAQIAAPRRGMAKPPAAFPGRCKKLIAQLSEYLDERLDDTSCGELEKHLADCQPCRALLSSLERTLEQCRRHRPGGVHPRLPARKYQALLAEYRRALASLHELER